VSAGFFETLGIPVVQGRSFGSQDRAGSARVAIVNQTLVAKYFEAKDPLGQAIALSGDQGLSEWMTIVGVAKDLMPANLAQGARPQIYVPSAQDPRRTLRLVIRTDRDPLSLADSARAAIWSIDRNLPIDRVSTVQDLINEDFRGGIALSYVFGVFGAVALTLATVGIYGVISYSAAQRTQEIGIRLALGASRRDVLGMVIGQGMKLIGIGTAIGILGAFAISRLLSGVLIGVSASDPLTFMAATVILAVVALLATYVPARRAMRIDPMAALRHE
jgi:putative ABC transport system permease protein